MPQTVVILGASEKSDRYSNKAFHLLKEYGHAPIPVSPRLKELEGMHVFSTLSEVTNPVDTLTMYVGPDKSTPLKNEILAMKPKRVIFNPGSENPELESALQKSGIEVVIGCTLVMLRTNQFELEKTLN